MMSIDINQITTKIMSSRTISYREQNLILSLISEGCLNKDERALVERLIYGMRRGLLTLVD